MKQKEILLGALLVAIAATLWHNLRREGDEVHAPVPTRGQGIATARVPDPYPVDWAALASPRPIYDPSGRNIFKWGPDRVSALSTEVRSPVIPQAQPVVPSVTITAAAPATAPVSAEIAPAAPRPPQIPYVFIGYVGPASRKTAVLFDGTGPIFAREGEILDGKFRVLEVGYDSIRFGYTDGRFRNETTLGMSTSN